MQLKLQVEQSIVDGVTKYIENKSHIAVKIRQTVVITIFLCRQFGLNIRFTTMLLVEMKNTGFIRTWFTA